MECQWKESKENREKKHTFVLLRFTNLTSPPFSPKVLQQSDTNQTPKNVEYEEKSHKTTPVSKNSSSRHRRGHNSQLPSVNVSFVLLLMCSQFCDLPLVLPYLIGTIQYAATPVIVVFCLMRTTALTLKSRAATWVEVCAKPAMQSQWAANNCETHFAFKHTNNMHI